jgi:hypothetical protein
VNVALWERVSDALDAGGADLDERELLVEAAQDVGTVEELSPEARGVLERLEARAAARERGEPGSGRQQPV